ncbi:hypothetical protein [uncultured Nostoc sp.]|nr:hypothetical protein [Nostoc sp. NMS8]
MKVKVLPFLIACRISSHIGYSSTPLNLTQALDPVSATNSWLLRLILLA